MQVALAAAADRIPPAASLSGGALYELKFDGYRGLIVRTVAGARIWSRQGVDLTSAFPDIAAAAQFHLAPGTVLDGVICSQLMSVANGGNEYLQGP